MSCMKAIIFFLQLEWEEHFGSTLKVYEKKHPFPGLLINYDDSSYIADDSDGDDDRDPYWLSQMFEYGFIRFIRLTSHFKPANSHKLFRMLLKDLIVLLFLSDVGVRYQNGKEITG